MHQISLAQALPSIPIRTFSHTTPTPTPPRQNPPPRMHSGSPLASHSLASPTADDHPGHQQDTLANNSKSKTPTLPPLRPRVQPPRPHVLPAAMDDMADLSRIGVLRATASMGDLHSRGQLPPSPYAKSYPSPLAASPNNAQSASTGTCTPNNASTTMTTTNNASLGFTLSTNPPAPRATAFRQGDWMCTAPGCGAHNFGRNSVCIGCGWARVHQQQLGGPTAASTTTTPTAAAAAVFGGGNFGRGGMGIGLGMAYPSDAVGGGIGGSGARPGVGNGIPRFASTSTSTSASTPTADVNGLESAVNLSLHPSAVHALGGPGGLNALQAAILAHQHSQQQQQARGVVDRPKVPHATIHGNNSNGKDAAAVAALNALQGLPGVGASSTSNGVPLLIPTTIAGNGNSPMVPSTLPGQTQGFSTLQQQLTHLQQQQKQQQQQQQQQQNPVLPTLTHHLTAAAAPPPVQAPPYVLPSLLTPSGRQIAQGGSIRNVSGDDTNPIFMFWPDNEPLPDPGQCRPPGLLCGFVAGNGSGPLPPILNTGNKGPIESQPGDWTCRKCEYLVSWVFFLGVGDLEVPITKHKESLTVALARGRCLPAELAGDRRRWRVPGRSSNRTTVNDCLILRGFVTGAPNYPHSVTFDRHNLRWLTSVHRTGVEDASAHCASHMRRATPKARRTQARMSRSASRSSLAFWRTRCKLRWHISNSSKCSLRPSNPNLNHRSRRSGSARSCVRIVSPLAI